MSAHPPVLFEPQSPNLAPLRPLLEQARGAKPNSSFHNAIRERLKHHLNVEKEAWKQMYLAGYEVANFIEGRQFLRPNPWAPGTYLSYTPKTTNEANKRTLNLMRFYATNALWKWQLSNPDIVAIAGVNTEEAREASKAADLIIEHYERKFFDPITTLHEGLHGLCWGTYVWRIRYDDSQHSITALQPIFGEQEVSLGEGYGQCGDCGYSGVGSEFADNGDGTAMCPQCGGTALVEQASEIVPTVVGQQEVKLGDLTAELLPFPECRWNISCRAEESSWFIHQRRTSASAIRRLLGNIKLPANSENDNDFGLDLVERLAWAGQAGGGQARTDFKKVKLYEEPVTIVEYSLGPDDIADIVLANAEETVSGQPLPAGPLLASFPDGITVQGINGLNIITGVFAEHHSSSIVQGVWHSRATSGTGQGFHDLVEVQKRFNADDSQVHTFLRAVGTPGMLFRQEAIGDQDRSDYLGDPRINIAVNSQNLPEGTRLEDIVKPAWQPQSVPGQLFSYTYERLNDFAQLTSHITDFSGGLPNVNNRTATGAQISQANSNALFTPPLQIKGEVRKRIAKLVLELYRKHFPVDRPFALKGKYGRQQYVYLNGANLNTDITLEVTKDSELPRNNFTKREDYTAFFATMGGGAGYAQMSQLFPELTAEIQAVFNIDLDTNTYDHIASLCQQRIQQMSDAAMFAEQAMQDPMVAQAAMGMGVTPDLLLMAITPPPALEEPDHDKKAKYLSEWLDYDEGQTAGPLLRQAVIALIQMHFQMFAITTAAMQSVMGPPPGEEGGDEGDGDSGGESKAKGGSAPKKKDGPNTAPPNTSPQRPITGRPEPNK